MKNLKISLSIIVAICLFAIGFTGCSTQKTIDSMVIGTTMDIQSISRSDYYYNVLSGTLTHLALVRLDENNEIQPMMAEYSTADNGKTWTFVLKDGLKWDDGEKVTAEDVKFTIEYLDKMENAGRMDKLEAINIVNDQTIQLVYKTANIRALNDLTTLRIIPKHIFENVTDYAGFKDDAAAIGCGPYKFVRFDADAGVLEFEANPDYIGGKPNIKTINVKLFKNTDTMYMALKAEEIGMVYFYAGGIDPSAAADLKSSGNITLTEVQDTSNPLVLIFNNEKTPVNSLPVRQAIAKGIDYEKCRELFGSEYSIPSNYGFIPKSNEGYIDTAALKLDIDGAKKILSDAGAIDSNGDGILEINGTPLDLEILVRTDKPVYARVGELLQSNLKAIGINVILNSVDVPTFRSMTETEHTDVSMLSRFTSFGMNMGAGMSTSYLDGRLKSNAQGQIMDPAFASIVDKLKAATTMAEYDQAAKECQEYYAGSVPAIALYWDVYLQAYNSKYDNFTIDGTFGIVNQQTWYSISQK
ncbi:hypothetical protein GH810_06110 [Acetobacterium paludosum]|uniref:Solute-binding protein family 5 domain-containing protein n=1 Tax=Acetobacterium paludosum TaxID=52693 RepID=A0A923I2G7_9FIRM|nr:ABC transporter substrate-binding protein [Acetobacterium paludosum]MBC3887880.1 hypothetical protein [Acetobacterium paludosum]